MIELAEIFLYKSDRTRTKKLRKAIPAQFKDS